MEIKHLLYDEKFTIAGAKKRLQEMKKEAAAAKKAKKASRTKKKEEPQVMEANPMPVGEDVNYKELLQDIKKELKELRAILEG